ncbi:hypothetical protein LQZ19_01920 [Treponema primitia]|uniref:hypothetical protein n=1 Tax=Treponema primitia TaxID=88058 RepID=UPI00397F7057
MKKTMFLLILGLAFLTKSHPQNMLMIGGDYNIMKPGFWGAGIGFNIRLFNNYLQNDALLMIGNVFLQDTDGKEEEKYLFYAKDNFYFSKEWKYIGLRAGAAVSLGIYENPDFPETIPLFLNAAVFAGLCFFPEALVSVTMDICPGHIFLFDILPSPSGNDSAFSMPVSISIRINLDRI